VERLLQGFPGIGPTGTAIFCREVQGVWTDLLAGCVRASLDDAVVRDVSRA
jgi:hypothetical protein